MHIHAPERITIFMNPNLRNVLIGLAIAAVAFFAWKFFSGGDAEAAINARLDALEEIAHKEGKESPFQAFGAAKKAANFAIERPYIELLPGMSPVDSRDSLATALAATRGRADTIDVSFTNRSIDIADVGDRALVVVNVSVKGNAFGETRSHSGKYRMQWEEIGGDWMITRVERAD